ncbi:hypothetical protein ABZ570_08815 [Micromonospora sp. NPDC007271]|uniref:hypothetical protein n=1 Tax=Micromonospora sp. NPDC007271 TaxID=3154587 RepID=UPI0033D13871
MTRVVAQDLMTLGVPDSRIRVEGQWRPSRYLTIDGVPAYQVGYSCGTCGLVLRRQPGAPDGRASASEVRDRLNAGLDGLDGRVVEAFGRVLPRSEYLVLLLDVRPHLVVPGSADDYFATAGPAAWRNEEHEGSVEPTNVRHYRLGSRSLADQHQLFEFLVPMTAPDGLDAATTAGYANLAGAPTAVAFGLLDIAGPWFRPVEHWGLFHFLLDGHHKAAAAALADRPLRLLTFVSAADSVATADDLLRLGELLGSRRG